MFKSLSLFAGFFVLLSNMVAATDTAVQPHDVPASAFASLDDVSNPKLSPSGKKLAYFVEVDGRRNLLLHDIGGTNAVRIPPWKEEQDFDDFFWKSDNIVVFKVSMTLNRIAFSGKTHETRAISFNIEKQKFLWLARPKKKKRERTSQHERIVDYLPDDPKHVLIELDFELDATPTVYRVNVENGRRVRVINGRQGIQDWYTDHKSVVRMGTGYRPNQSKFNAIYKNADGKWIDLDELSWTEKFDIEGFAEDPSHIYVSGPSEAGTIGLFKLEVESGEIKEQIFAHKDIDVEGAYQHPVTGHLAGVVYVDDYYRVKYLDEDLARLQRGLEKVLPDVVVSIVSKARDAQKYLIETRNDRSPGDFYIYDRKTRNLAWAMASRSAIDERIMAPVLAVSIPVRDNSEIPAYLTVPYETEAKNLPTIILPHGGPHVRDTADWDFWAQFYASRGYLVLQPNFRGSSGYGPAFRWAGVQQWGGLMQDDVTDATRWLIETGKADPNRICIVGASYGGYAALMGPIKEPELYRCAVSVNGVTDLIRMKQYDKKLVGGRAFIKNMGLKDTDDKDVSPSRRAEEISVPVLLIASKDDTVVPFNQSKLMHKELKKLNKDARYLELKNGTHHMVTAESRLLMLEATEKFLAKHIGK